jgi:hypothetical protein
MRISLRATVGSQRGLWGPPETHTCLCRYETCSARVLIGSVLFFAALHLFLQVCTVDGGVSMCLLPDMAAVCQGVGFNLRLGVQWVVRRSQRKYQSWRPTQHTIVGTVKLV